MTIVDVVLPLPIRASFSYILPDSIVPIVGGRVLVPFRSKEIIGIIIAISQKKNIKNFKFVKHIIDNESIFNTSLLKTLIWLSKYYHYPIGSLFFLILPKILNSKDREFRKNNINKVSKLKINKKIFLNKKILFKINQILIKNVFSSWLVSEVNLYIKIKFYLGLFKEILKKNLQILIIVPFIKDIYKILIFLKQYFNIPIDIIHSNLSDEKFLNVWIRAKDGGSSIIIGTKESVFFPFLQLGLIIVYEEHNIIYKNIDAFKCNIRDIAILRAYNGKIPIILDSISPSLKTLYNIINKKYFWINLRQNTGFFALRNEIIDLNKEKITIGLSNTLINKVFENIEKNFSALLIFNPSNFIFLGLICKNCQWIPKCNICNDYCEVSKYNNMLCCKHCLINFKQPLFCDNCQFFPLTKFNFGIKKIKKSIKKLFPNIPLLFLTNLKKIEINKLDLNISQFSILHSGIIITTEKIAKNYYFPNVRLIGLVNVDYYFFSLNFCNAEYFYQFYFNLVSLIQKNSKYLNIFIQTSLPDNDYLKRMLNKKYLFCAYNILTLRKKYLLPPWSFQVTVYCQSKNFKNSFIFLKFIYISLKKQSKKDNMLLWFVGPYSIFSKSKKQYFQKLLIQCSSRLYLQKMLRISLDNSKIFSIFNCVKWFIDFDLN